MKKIHVCFIAFLLLIVTVACEKGNYYYEGYQNTIKTYDGNIYQYLENNKGVFDSLLLVLDRIYPLQDSLKKEGVTLFAPTNQSFQLALQNLNAQRKLANKKPLYLEDVKRDVLDTLISRYMFTDEITTENIRLLKDGRLKKSMNYQYEMHVKYGVLNASGYVGGGQQQIVFTDPNNSIFERYWEKSVTNSVNIHTNNGIIHILTPSHNFGFGKLGMHSN